MKENIFRFVQGEIRTLSFLVTMNKRPDDLSTSTLQLLVKRHKDDPTPVISKADSDFFDVYAVDGIVSVNLSLSDTADLAPGTYVGQLKITGADGKVRKTGLFSLELLPALDSVFFLETTILAEASAGEPELSIS